MINLAQYQGIGHFGSAYRITMENDTHAPGSVDRVLDERMVRLCAETASFLYGEYTLRDLEYVDGSRPNLERWFDNATSNRNSDDGKVAAVSSWCAQLGAQAPEALDGMRFGGTEEQVVRRGSDWCTDVARVACTMCQVGGIPARLVSLFNTSQANSGHQIIEAFHRGVWGAADPVNGVVYRHPNGAPATTWQLMRRPRLIEANWKDRTSFYADPGQFKEAAIANYFVWQHNKYDYTISGVNDYCRSILEMSIKGWPGGLRWLHGEDQT